MAPRRACKEQQKRRAGLLPLGALAAAAALLACLLRPGAAWLRMPLHGKERVAREDLEKEVWKIKRKEPLKQKLLEMGIRTPTTHQLPKIRAAYVDAVLERSRWPADMTQPGGPFSQVNNLSTKEAKAAMRQRNLTITGSLANLKHRLLEAMYQDREAKDNDVMHLLSQWMLGEKLGQKRQARRVLNFLTKEMLGEEETLGVEDLEEEDFEEAATAVKEAAEEAATATAVAAETVAEPAVVEEPVAPEQVAEQPAVEQPVAEQSAEPVAEQPVAEQPVPAAVEEADEAFVEQPTSVMVVMSGLQGSGKSTLCKLLGRAFAGSLWMNQDEVPVPGSKRGAVFNKGVQGTLQAVAAAGLPRLVLFDKMNHVEKHRKTIFKVMRDSHWRSYGGAALLVELAPQEGSWDIAQLHQRIEGRGEAHRTLTPSEGELSTILERTARDSVPTSPEERARFEGVLQLDPAIEVVDKAVQVVGKLVEMQWTNSMHWRYLLAGHELPEPESLEGLEKWVEQLPYAGKVEPNQAGWEELRAFFQAEFEKLQAEEEAWRTKSAATAEAAQPAR